MRAEPPLPNLAGAFDLGAFARAVVLSGIEAVQDDPSEMKERIMQARLDDYLTDEETREWIVRYGLEAA